MTYAVITGASSGIGKAMAFEFAAQGFNLVLAARREALLQEIAGQLRNSFDIDVQVKVTDLAKADEADNLFAAVKHLDITLWVNNAGFGDYNYPWESSARKIGRMVDVNVRALATLSLNFVQHFRDTPAVLMNLSSGAGYGIYGLAVPYCASKFYVSALTEGIDHSLRDSGSPMRAKVLAPGPVNTEFEEVSVTESTHSEHNWEQANTAEEIAHFAMALYRSEHCLGLVVDGKLELQNARLPVIPVETP